MRRPLITISFLFLLVLILSLSFFASNYLLFFPEMSKSESIYTLPLNKQLVLFAAFFVLALYFLLRRKKMVPAVLLMLAFSTALLGTYTIRISHQGHMVASSVGPIKLDQLPVSDDMRIVKSELGYRLSNEHNTMEIYTDLIASNQQQQEINQRLVALGKCEKNTAEICTEIDVTNP